jgi:hypothetical protein
MVLDIQFQGLIIRVTPDAGHIFKGWSKDGGTTLLTDSMMLSEKINSNTTYKAYYSLKAPKLSLASSGDGYALLEWNGILGATTYKIYQNNSIIADAVYDAVYTVSDAVYNYNASKLTNGCLYSFAVEVLDKEGNTVQSNKKVKIQFSQ